MNAPKSPICEYERVISTTEAIQKGVSEDEFVSVRGGSHMECGFGKPSFQLVWIYSCVG